MSLRVERPIYYGDIVVGSVQAPEYDDTESTEWFEEAVLFGREALDALLTRYPDGPRTDLGLEWSRPAWSYLLIQQIASVLSSKATHKGLERGIRLAFLQQWGSSALEYLGSPPGTPVPFGQQTEGLIQ